MDEQPAEMGELEEGRLRDCRQSRRRDVKLPKRTWALYAVYYTESGQGRRVQASCIVRITIEGTCVICVRSIQIWKAIRNQTAIERRI